MVAIKAIRNKSQYQYYLKKVDVLMEPDPSFNSREGQLLETLTILIEDYERKQGWEILLSEDPVEVIKTRMQVLGLKQTDLAEAIGDKTVVSRILKRSRKLTYSMITPLSNLLCIPPEFLLER